ncbi:Cupin-like domain-containing protein [Pseudoduganella flava]|uniref:Cupin-like domain-containing protein n=1 Tax=Pseudoduganella flava TaxID=871742 RepID=A0A562PGQ5_9BURK|nr:cupin-like domain-containing protein [Pseudoduganella flava]QGZ40365.1 cupin-like domain-containing protein [Pseudoduganella flava]TWI43558.1 Cupin-like domain-containing protein [Pseudoduganella flava]
MLPVAELKGLTPRDLNARILTSTQPLLLRGLVAHWPMVRAAQQSQQAASDYLLRFYGNTPVVAMLGPPEIRGRFFYNDDISGFNFRPVHAPLQGVLAELEAHRADAEPPAIYVGSTTIDAVLPGFRAENDVDLQGREPLASIWIGNRTRIAAHYDAPDNLACVTAGRRRFTLFPPDQLRNLYVGPLDLTPAGQPISLVDLHDPDFTRFPRFREALEHAQVAEMEPGDALFLPSMWWHHVEALEPFNVLVNYWWRQSPHYADTPTNALMYAIATIRDLPPAQRDAWRELFRHYVFEADDDTAAHIPPASRRMLAPLTEDMTRAVRAQLIKRLNR